MSAVGLIAFGLVTLRGGKERSRGSFAFGLFAVAWGLNISLANLGGAMPSEAAAAKSLLLSLPFLFLLPFLLIEFAQGQLGRRHQPRRWAVVRATTMLLALALSMILAVSPERFLQSVAMGPNGPVVEWGPLQTLAKAALFTSIGVTLWALCRVVERSPTPRTMRQAATLFIGLGLYAGHAMGNNAAFYGLWLGTWGPTATNVPYAILFTVLSALVLTLGVRLWRRARDDPTDGERRLRRSMALALLIPLSWGLLEGAVALYWLPRFYTVGLWRLAGVGVIAYGLAHLRDFELPRRLGTPARLSAAAVGAALGGVVGYGAATMFFAGSMLPVLTGLAGSGLAAVPSARLSERVLLQPLGTNPVSFGESVYTQRVEAYRSALEASLARGTLHEDETFLEDLRGRYDISEPEDRILRYYARHAALASDDPHVTGAYERLRIVSEQGIGRSWLARDRSRDRLVVLKEPLPQWHADPALGRSVVEQARRAKELRHPCLARVEEILEEGGRPVLVLEHVAGAPLDRLLAQRGHLPHREALSIAHDVLSALDALHRAGCQHGALQASSIIVNDQARARLWDLGLTPKLPSHGHTLMPGETPRPTDPVEDQGPAARQVADVHAVGELLHQCIYGAPPRQDAAVLVRPRVPDPVAALVSRAVAQDPTRRFQDAATFAGEIEAIVLDP